MSDMTVFKRRGTDGRVTRGEAKSLLAIRVQPDQADYLEAQRRKGYGSSEVLRTVLTTWIELEAELGDPSMRRTLALAAESDVGLGVALARAIALGLPALEAEVRKRG